MNVVWFVMGLMVGSFLIWLAMLGLSPLANVRGHELMRTHYGHADKRLV
jgi:hypothetical protein